MPCSQWGKGGALRGSSLLILVTLFSCLSACVVDPLIPPRLLAHAAVQPLCAGYVDVTKPPYSAAGDGLADDHAALQAAANDAYAASMTVLLPAGRVFLLSQQLLLLQRLCYAPCGYTRRHGMQVVGGGGGARPVVRLRDNATVAASQPSNCPGLGRVFILFDAVLDDNATLGNQASEYQARWRGIDIHMGFNPDIAALSMLGAQLCSIEDTAISGEAFLAGVNGLPSSGGFSANVNVTGGTIGVLHDCYRPNPSIAGLQLVGQARAGVLVRRSRGPVVLTGFRIESPPTPDPAWRAILLNSSSSGPQPQQDDSLAGEDGVILQHGSSSSAAAVESGGCDVALRNVYFSPGTAPLFAAPSQGVLIPRGSAPPGEWVQLPLLAFSASGASMWDAGVNASGSGSGATAYVPHPGPTSSPAPPPEGLAASHTWPPHQVPTWPAASGSGLLDVLAWGATPTWVNATDDDGAAIQAALDASCTSGSAEFGLPVFLPHGEYGLYRPLQLRACARLVGAGSHSAWLRALPAAPTDASACWQPQAELQPLAAMLVSRASSSSSSAAAPLPPPLLSDLGLLARPLCPILDLGAGGGAEALLRDVCLAPTEPPPTFGVPPSTSAVPPLQPLVALSGGYSGRVFGLSLDLVYAGNNGSSPAPGPYHVLLLLNGTGSSGPLHLYQLSTEHKPGARLALFAGAREAHVHAWKSESVLGEPHTGGAGDAQSLVGMVGCTNVSLFGHSGNFRQFNTTVGVVDVTGGGGGLLFMALTRTYISGEPAQGTMWVRDAAVGVALDGHHQVGLFRAT